MSYILNALRKSEQQRQIDQTPTLEKSVLENKVEENSWKSSLVFLLIIVNLVTFALFIWLYQENANSLTTPVENTGKQLSSVPHSKTDIVHTNKTTFSEKSRDIPKSSVHPKNSKTISDILQQKTRQDKTNRSQPDNNKTAAVTGQNQSIPTANDAPEVQINEPHSSILTRQKTAAENSNSNTTELLQNKPKAAIASIDKTSINNRSNKAPSPPSNKQATENRIPWLKELPNEFRHRVPTLNINVFAYSDHPSERFVLIDMVKYITGQQIAADMQLKEILSDSMVVGFGGKTFRIQRP